MWKWICCYFFKIVNPFGKKHWALKLQSVLYLSRHVLKLQLLAPTLSAYWFHAKQGILQYRISHGWRAGQCHEKSTGPEKTHHLVASIYLQKKGHRLRKLHTSFMYLSLNLPFEFWWSYFSCKIMTVCNPHTGHWTTQYWSLSLSAFGGLDWTS